MIIIRFTYYNIGWNVCKLNVKVDEITIQKYAHATNSRVCCGYVNLEIPNLITISFLWILSTQGNITYVSKILT